MHCNGAMAEGLIENFPSQRSDYNKEGIIFHRAFPDHEVVQFQF